MENKNNSNEKVKKNEPIILDIPVEGSLGLLAYGAKGIKAWRKKRDEVLAQQPKKTENE